MLWLPLPDGINSAPHRLLIKLGPCNYFTVSHIILQEAALSLGENCIRTGSSAYYSYFLSTFIRAGHVMYS